MCHNGRCFQHLLENGIHSSEAVLLWHSDVTRKVWHARHIGAGKGVYGLGLGDVEKAGREGISLTVRFQLVAMAQKYPDCRPLNSRVKRGWYDAREKGSTSDEDLVSTSVVARKPHLQVQIPATSRRLNDPDQASPLSPLTDLDSPMDEKGDIDASSFVEEAHFVPNYVHAGPSNIRSEPLVPHSDGTYHTTSGSSIEQSNVVLRIPALKRRHQISNVPDAQEVDEEITVHEPKRKKHKIHEQSSSGLQDQMKHKVCLFFPVGHHNSTRSTSR